MIFAVLFEDNPGQEHLRRTHMQDHLAFLERHGGVAGAGPLFDATSAGRGGLWLVEADSADKVQAMVRADPFYPTGLRKSVTVLEWRHVLRDGKRVI